MAVWTSSPRLRCGQCGSGGAASTSASAREKLNAPAQWSARTGTAKGTEHKTTPAVNTTVVD
eukprot:1186376-Prorocentrum_minimum.AAC.4